MSIALDALIFVTAWAHVMLSPYTKVEESFNLHAIHDVLMYGVGRASLPKYDHFVFPGAVPRTFVGSVLLAWMSKAVIYFAERLGFVSSKFDLQIIVRLVLASLNSVGLCCIQRGVSRRFGRLTGLFFTLFTVSQFHLPFWMGRTLPNMLALFPVNLATYLIVDGPPAIQPSNSRVTTVIALLTFTAVVFRAEIFLLLGPLSLQFLYLRYITFPRLVKVGVLSALVSVTLTILVDSYFWDTKYLWPEFFGIYFNVYQGKSADWGVDPPLTYFTRHLPRLLLSAVQLSLLGLYIDHRIRSLLLPSIIFVALISGLGHKEWRFIIYVVPTFNVAAARAAKWLVGRGKKELSGRLLYAGIFGLLFMNVVITFAHTCASIANYPGGEALSLFNQRYQRLRSPLHVHISNLAAQTGASLFLQEHSPPYLTPVKDRSWTYDKTENLTLQDLNASQSITHLIMEVTETTPEQWTVVEEVQGFNRWRVDHGILSGRKELLRYPWDIVIMSKTTMLWIMERND
ncbi:alpha-1,6-mannosyltransferase subunit [Guyanagaster necrorhizus]|uniref:Mannosyltransferase n=1 Tax=Guyanagaster necrorhizus TaxID=856835 RepID=A0A9P8AX48_9AGAR|nr:alpha-1,6-mannosyltransferase subunit [Guyanagaster necrorhizus MCA 3950]KAG7451384.1 alpha-1,6-mannosyltransferase subunit [Guyanagaster necrorhizus MCA 3950]